MENWFAYEKLPVPGGLKKVVNGSFPNGNGLKKIGPG